MAARALASLVGFAFLLVFAPVASAITIDVDSTADESTNNGSCSLREAVKAANLNSNAHESGCEVGQSSVDNILLPAGTYTLAGAAGEDANASGDLDIVGSGGPLVVIGLTAPVTHVPTSIIDGGDNDRIFDIQPSGSITEFAALQLILQNGKVTGGADGGAIRYGDPDGRLTVTTARLVGNDAGHYGGAISFDNGGAGAFFKLSEVELSGNTSGDDGGALYLDMPDQSILGGSGVQPSIDHSAFI